MEIKIAFGWLVVILGIVKIRIVKEALKLLSDILGK